MKPTVIFNRLKSVQGRCVVELKGGGVVTASHIYDIPQAVRDAGGRWPEDVHYANRRNHEDRCKVF